YALTLFISLTVFFNRYWVRFTLDEDGVLYESVRWSRKVSGAINAGAVVLGLLAAMPAAAGAGLMARSRQTVFLPWNRVRKVRCFDRFRVITLSNSWRPFLRLHCPTDEHYAQAQEKIRMALPTME
ncbi:hypothetical protein JW992_13315, partial [candidate division KSB1 bacterium]|nr:hypothetical protein [candidate division KSB1 bacterium]